ncbi:hypothetical protein [Mycobacterium sp.]|uniref:hypothetical protein n=1 Tax=Mycobacterium sp. TaxID=1785 RepID=UPI003A87B669
MTVAAFVLGLTATALALVSLGWQAVTTRRRRPSPALSPRVATQAPQELVATETGTVGDGSALIAVGPPDEDPLVIGVRVVAAGTDTEPPRIMLTVVSGDHRYDTGPIPPEIFSIASETS